MESVPRRLPKKRSASHIAPENDTGDTVRQSYSSHSHVDSFDPYDLSALDGGARPSPKATLQPLPRARPSLGASRPSKARLSNQGRARTTGKIATELPSRTSVPALPKRSKTQDDIARSIKRGASEPKQSQGTGVEGGYASPSMGGGADRSSAAGRGAAGKRGDVTRSQTDDKRQITTATPTIEAESAGPDSPLESTRGAASSAPLQNTRSQPRTLERTPSAHKFTYGSKRSMLRESSSSLDLTTDPLAAFAPRVSPELPSLNPNSLSMDESEDETSHKGAIKSIHELRQAGANNRFADELDDLLERIDVPQSGTPSLRRVALLETATKLHERRFCRQFCDHGAQVRLFTDLGKEDDVINGFTLVSSLHTLFTASAGSSALRYMQTVGAFQLFKKLLQQEDDICVVGKRRDANLSRRNQLTLASLKTTVLRPGSWDTIPTTLSPRTLALKLLVTACQRMENTIPMKAFGHITDELFTILNARRRPDRCIEVEKLDRVMAASILGDLSAPAMESELAERWTKDYAEAVSVALREVLEQPVHSFGSYENSILKLAMNSTNNSEPTAEWKGHECLGKLARSSCACFQLVKDGVKEGGAWNAAVYDQLLLILGIMINFCEHLPPSSSPVDDASLGSLVRTYLDNHALTHEADSVEESQLNVAVGYLAIVLGYLSLSPEVRWQLDSSGLLTRLDCLANSIKEFIQVYKSVDSSSKTGSGSHVSRLQRLVELLSS